MRYVVLLADDPRGWETATEAEREAVMQAHTDFDKAVRERASMVAGEALADASEARTLRPGAGGRSVTDGPYAEAAEQLGGFYVIDAPDLDTVTELCQLLPASYTIEIRPVVVIDGYDYEARG